MPQADSAVDDFRRWTLKDLRHTFVSELHDAGVPVTHVAHRLGDAVKTDDGQGGSRRVRAKAVEVYDHCSDRHVAYAVSVIANSVGAGKLRLFNPAGPQA